MRTLIKNQTSPPPAKKLSEQTDDCYTDEESYTQPSFKNPKNFQPSTSNFTIEPFLENIFLYILENFHDIRSSQQVEYMFNGCFDQMRKRMGLN